MPVAIAGALIAGGIAAAEGTVIFGLSTTLSAIAIGAFSFVSSELGSALTPKPKKAAATALAADTRTQQITQAVVPDETVYGVSLKSGSLVYASNTDNNAYTHIIIVLADHEIAGIDEVMVDSDVVPNDWLDAGGNVTQGKYAGYLRIKKHLGGAGQTADADLVAEDTAWTAAHRLAGRAYLYARYERSASVFPQSPNFAAIVRGKRPFDTRTGMLAWTRNLALMAYDWRTDAKLGLGIDVSKIGTDETEAAANACDELVATQGVEMTVTAIDTATGIVSLTDAASDSLLQFQHGDAVQVTSTGTLPAGLAAATDYYVIPYQYNGTPRVKLAASLADAMANDGVGTAVAITDAGTGTVTLTKTHEPRYWGGGVISSDTAGGDALQSILSGMAGRQTYTGGLFRDYAGVWRGPSVTINEDDLRGPVSVQTATTFTSKFNTVIGNYISPINSWQAADYPQVQSATALAADMGDVLNTTIDLAFTQSAATAQRIATLKLALARQPLVITWPGKLTALQLQPMDTLYVDNTRFGWDAKVFEVQTWKLGFQNSGAGGDDSVPVPGIDMVLQETSPDCYAWTSAQEITVDPAPNTNLPNPFNIHQIVGLSISSIAVQTKSGDTLYRALAAWDPIADAYVVNGGWVHFQYRLSGAVTYTALPPVPAATATQADIFSGALGTAYDLQVWLENSLGIIGPKVTLAGLSLGSAGGIGATLDWGSVNDAPTTNNDWGSVADAPTTNNDWGGVA